MVSVLFNSKALLRPPISLWHSSWSCLTDYFLRAIMLPSNKFLSDYSSQNQFLLLANKETLMVQGKEESNREVFQQKKLHNLVTERKRGSETQPLG